MMYVAAYLALVVVCIVVENYTFRATAREIRQRRKRGDFGCEMQQTFYGWRLKERPENGGWQR